jgi:hypothetical protein
MYQIRAEQIEFVIQNDKLTHQLVLHVAVHQSIVPTIAVTWLGAYDVVERLQLAYLRCAIALGFRLRSASPDDSARTGTRGDNSWSCRLRAIRRRCSRCQTLFGTVDRGRRHDLANPRGLNWLVGLGFALSACHSDIRDIRLFFTRLIEVLASRNVLPVFAIGKWRVRIPRKAGCYFLSEVQRLIRRGQHCDYQVGLR